MATTPKAQLGVEVDPSGAKAGFDQVKQGAKEMARAVGDAGEKAGEGLDKGLGQGAKGAGDKVQRETRQIIASIERATAAAQAGGRGTAAYYEQIAKQRGISGDALAPYIAQLKAAEAAQAAAAASLGNMGLSAKQTAAALRGVPAQFTDIVTSLQGGQAPLTVFLQQGGQLRDMFGSAGGAAKALGGFVAGLITPMSLAAAAAAALAAGFLSGSKEAQEFNKALVLTGNQAGTTVGELSAMAQRLDGLGTTTGRAAEVLTEFARSGRVGADSLERFSLAAINLERVGGPAVAETVKAFAELGKDPLQASLKLNESTGFLTRSIYEQIQALDAQGLSVEAAKVAQEGYAAAIEERTPQIVAQLGYVERAWKGIVDFAKEAVDAIKDVGRVDNSLQAAIARTEQQAAAARAVGDARAANESDRLLERLRESLALQQGVVRLEAERVRQVQAKAEWDKAGLQYLSAAAKLERDILQVRNAGLAAGESEAAIQARIAALREKSRDKGGDNRAARAAEQEAQALEKAIGLTGTYVKDLQQLQALRAKGALGEEQYVAAVRKIVEAQPMVAAQLKDEEAARKASAKSLQDLITAEDQRVAALYKSADAVAQQVQKLQDEERATALAAGSQLTLRQALEQVAIARLEEAKAKATAGADFAGAAALAEEIAQRQKLIALIGGQDLRAATEKASQQLDEFLDPGKAETFGEALTRAFDGAGNGLAKLSNALQDYGRQQARLANAQTLADKEIDATKRLRAQSKINEDSQKSQVALYANMAGAAKSFFAEGSRGYKALEAAETAWRAYQLASDLVKGASAAAVGIATQAQGDPYTAFGRMAAMAAAMASLGFAVSGGFAGGPSSGGDGRPVNTGTGTVFGDAEAQSESISRSIDRMADTASLQLRTQSGMLQALRSIEANIGGLSGLVLRGQATGGTAAERFGIREGTTVPGGALTSVIAGGIVGLADHLLFGGKVTQALFGKKVRVTGSGLFAGAQDLGSIVGNGLNLQDYADVNTTQKFLGIKVSNKNSTQYSAADPVLQQQFGLVFQGFYDAIRAASQPLDLALSDVTGRLDAFVVDIGKIELAGLTGEQINERLTAVLGAAGDRIAEAAIPGLQAFQVVGEGYFETLVRVASGIETAEAALDLLGITAINYGDIARKQGDVAAEIVRQSIAGFESLDGSLSSVGALITTLDGSAEDISSAYAALVDVRQVLIAVGASGDSLTASMLRGAGGLEALQGSLGTYFEEFFSADERAAAARAQLQGQFDRLGLGGLPATREAFRALVQAQDTTTEAGQKLYAQLLGLSGAFAELVPASAAAAESVDELAARMAQAAQRSLDQLASQRGGLEVALLRAQGDPTAAAARQRQLDLASLTAGTSPELAAAIAAAYDYNRALEAQAASLTEAARAAAAAASAEAQRTAAIANERAGLQQQIDQLIGNTGALRARELAALDESNRALQERIFALQDAAAAEAEAARLAEEAAQRTAAIANERAGLQQQIDQLTGNTGALRARELAALDESNRAMQERIYLLIDQQAAADRAAQAMQALDSALSSLGDSRFGLEQQLLGLQGNSAEAQRLARERDLARLTAGLTPEQAAQVVAAYDYNLALQRQIDTTIAAQQAAEQLAAEQARAAEEAARAAEQFKSAWQSVTDTLFEEAARIRGLAGGQDSLSLAQAQAQFAITTAQARAGDQDAARSLPGLSQTLLDLATANAGSLIELNRIRAQIAASLEQTGQGLAGLFGLGVPRLASGTNYVPRDMLAVLHEGEAVQPSAYNPAAGGSQGLQSMADAVQGLRDDQRAQMLALVQAQRDVKSLLSRWDASGLPEERQTA